MSTSDVTVDDISSVDRFMTISANDLDEMFDKNLQLLQNIEKDELSSNLSSQSSRRYHSSINVYLNPNEKRLSKETYYSYCNVIPMTDSKLCNQKIIRKSVINKKSNYLTKLPLYSSYETLYDNLTTNTKDDIMIKSMINNNHSSFNKFLDIDDNKSSDSDRTLKSLSTDEISSSVSSLDNHDDQFSFRQISNNNNNSPRLRDLSNSQPNRPNSCYVDTEFGQYKHNVHSNMVVIKRRESNDQSNLIISKPLGNYPSRFCNSILSINNDQTFDPYYLSGSSYDSNGNRSYPDFIQHLSYNNRIHSSSNIINNHIISNGIKQLNGSTKSTNIIINPKPINPISNSINNSTNLSNKNDGHYLKPQSQFIKPNQNAMKISSRNYITKSENPNLDFTEFSSLMTDYATSQCKPTDEVKTVSHSKSYHIQRIDNKT